MTHREIRSDESSATSLLQIHHAEEDDDDDLHCPQCLISFRSAKTKETHFKRNHPEQYTRHLMQNDTLFSCYKCDKLFASPEELRVHNGLHYQVDDIPVCSSCSQVFANFNGLYKHKRKGCVQDVWHCRDCNVDCPKLLDFHFHCIEAHDQDVVSAAQSSGRLCSICECHFLTDEALQSHQDRVKSGKMKPTTKRQLRAKTKKVSGKKKKKMEEEDEEEEDEEEEEIEEEELKIPCSKRDCDLVFPSIDALRAHKRKMH